MPELKGFKIVDGKAVAVVDFPEARTFKLVHKNQADALVAQIKKDDQK